MDIGSALTGGGSAALVIAIAYAGRLALDWWRESKIPSPTTPATAAVKDAATANALLLSSLREEREETQRLSAEVAELRTQNAHLYQQMRQQRKDYEREVAELRNRLTALTEQVEAFQRKLQQP